MQNISSYTVMYAGRWFGARDYGHDLCYGGILHLSTYCSTVVHPPPSTRRAGNFASFILTVAMCDGDSTFWPTIKCLAEGGSSTPKPSNHCIVGIAQVRPTCSELACTFMHLDAIVCTCLQACMTLRASTLTRMRFHASPREFFAACNCLYVCLQNAREFSTLHAS